MEARLCDEAISVLDVQTTGEIVDILKEINSKLGIIIVFITHQPNLALDIYSTKYKCLSEVVDRATLTVPNDVTNLGRALK